MSEETMKTLTVPRRMIDMGLAMSGPKYGVMAALKAQASGLGILWLRANGSATLFYRGWWAHCPPAPLTSNE